MRHMVYRLAGKTLDGCPSAASAPRSVPPRQRGSLGPSHRSLPLRESCLKHRPVTY